ncbi:crystal protein [Ephemerocybe angulata]|uniref:Carboxylic ester hydrolase n=1 Tax=Ephemerocybe angulata TaxID=980116 RepID=A0A8H6IEJ6_9AGAR|nr:crystal protein [Tulosesus angulatus]
MFSTLLIPLLFQINPAKILCQMPLVKKFLCPAGGLNGLSRATVFGTASGVVDADGAYRYPVKYATSSRWAPSTLVSAWNLPNGSNNVSALPLACPQPDVPSTAYTEDCLSMVLYVPQSLTLNSNAPVLVWLHGGSFVVGSATATGLDGSKLAQATNSIVAVVQYRLGALGFLAPNGNTNLAVKDVVNALEFIKRAAPAFGGSASKVTLAGQSAGATMIRALLSAPSASSLFRSTILQSDPMNFAHWMQQLSPCQNGLSITSILAAQKTVYDSAPNLDPAAGNAQPIRPVLDGTFITTPLDISSTFPSVSKPLLVTSVSNEATYAIYDVFRDPIPEEYFPDICAATFGEERTTTVISSPFYQPSPGSIVDGEVDARAQLAILGTDYLWKCSGWTFARAWVQHGGNAFVGQYVVGATYPGNEQVPLCTQSDVICHQDDIQIVFGTVSNPTSAQSALITEVQQRYKAFLNNGNPNVAGLPNWAPATTTDVHSIRLGGTGEAPIGACDPTFWGSTVDYDYQYYN